MPSTAPSTGEDDVGVAWIDLSACAGRPSRKGAEQVRHFDRSSGHAVEITHP